MSHPPSPRVVEDLIMRIIMTMSCLNRSVKSIYRGVFCMSFCVSIRRYPRSSGWMIQAESGVERVVCVLSVGDNVGVLVRS